MKIQEKIEHILYNIKQIKDSDLFIEYKSYQEKNVSAENIFESISGNSGLTEEYLYSIMLHSGDRKFNVLTGSINVTDTQKTYECYKPKNETEKINVLQGEGIHIVRKGKAGAINYLQKGNYTLNDDAYVLVLKKKIDYKISLKWFTYTYAHKFKEYSSSSDNGTWNKSGFFEHATFDIPDFEEQIFYLKKFEELETYQNKLNSLATEIKNVFDIEIIEM